MPLQSIPSAAAAVESITRDYRIYYISLSFLDAPTHFGSREKHQGITKTRRKWKRNETETENRNHKNVDDEDDDVDSIANTNRKYFIFG